MTTGVTLLALKLTLAPVIILAVTLSSHRWGARVAGRLSALPQSFCATLAVLLSIAPLALVFPAAILVALAANALTTGMVWRRSRSG